MEGKKLIQSAYTWDGLETKLVEIIEAGLLAARTPPEGAGQVVPSPRRS
jgi:hypothetical protein